MYFAESIEEIAESIEQSRELKTNLALVFSAQRIKMYFDNII